MQILLVEDDEVDVEAMLRAFRKNKVSKPVVVAGDGVEALKILRGNGNDALSRPHIVLLDLNMPRMNGIEFLGRLRKDPVLRDTIVFVLTTSDQESDKRAAYERNVAGYLLKSRVGEGFRCLIDLIEDYTNIVEFPA